MVDLNESNIVLITICYIRNCEKNCVPNIISINPTKVQNKTYPQDESIPDRLADDTR